MPLTVISHGIGEPDAGEIELPGISKAMEVAWQDAQVSLARFVPAGTRVVATRSHHPIPSEQPALIVNTIKSMLAELDSATIR